MTKTRTLALLVVAAAAMGLMAGCTQPSSTAQPPGGAPKPSVTTTAAAKAGPLTFAPGRWQPLFDGKTFEEL